MLSLVMKLRFAVLFLAVLAMIVFAGAGCQQQKSAKLSGPPEKITIAYAVLPHAALFHIAHTKGFFSAEGLDVTAQPHEFGRLALNSVLEGNADLATVADTPIMFAIAGGKSIYTIAVISTISKATAIVARKDSGIAKPADLRGKTIGVTKGTTAEFFMDSFLSTRGIDGKEVRIVNLKPNEMPDALINGRVDAVSIFNPMQKIAQKALADNGVSFYDETIYSDIFCLAGGQKFVKNRPGAVRKVLKALITAEAFVKQNPEESRSLIADFTKMEKGLFDETWGSSDFRVTLDQALVVSLEDQTRWAQRNKLAGGTKVPNYLDFIYFDGLQSVKPAVVGIMR